MSRLRWLGLGVALAAFLIGCQGTPSTPKVAPADPLAPAREAMERGDYAGAATLLRKFLASNPDSLEAHYRLGVSATYLEPKDEAIREFKWVVAHGPADSNEVQTARTWLIRAGVLVERRPPPQVASPEPSRPEKAIPAQKPNLASLSGTVTGEEVAAAKPMTRLQLFLRGAPNSPVKDKFYALRTDFDGRYRFINVSPGEYIFTNTLAGAPDWRLKVTVEPGQNLVLDLTPRNSVKIRDDFPGLY